MVHGYEPGRPAARRARRLVRRRSGDPAGAAAAAERVAPAVPAAPAAGDVPAPTDTDAWFDSWLTGDEDAVLLDPPDGWTTLHDLHRPGSASRTLDCLAIGPGGVVVIQSLRWEGTTTVADGTLRHRGYGRTPDVAAAADAAGTVTALLAPSHRRTVRAVVSLAGQDLEPAPVRGGAVAVGERRLAGWLGALPPVLAPADVHLVRDYLAAELTGPASPELLTVDDVFRPREVWAAPDVPPQRPGPADAEAWPVGGSGSGAGVDGGAGWGTDPGVSAGTDAGVGSGVDAGASAGSDAGAGPSRDPVGGSDEETGNRIDGGWPDVSLPEGVRGGTARDVPVRSQAAAPGRTPVRGARGDGALRVGMLVLGLLTVGNVLLAWLDAAG